MIAMKKVYAQIGSPRMGAIVMPITEAIAMVEKKLKSGKYFVVQAMVASHISCQLFMKIEAMNDKITEVLPIVFVHPPKNNQTFYLVQKTDTTFDYFGKAWWKIPREHFDRVTTVSLTAPIFAGNIASQLFAPDNEPERNDIIDAFLNMCRLFAESK